MIYKVLLPRSVTTPASHFCFCFLCPFFHRSRAAVNWESLVSSHMVARKCHPSPRKFTPHPHHIHTTTTTTTAPERRHFRCGVTSTSVVVWLWCELSWWRVALTGHHTVKMSRTRFAAIFIAVACRQSGSERAASCQLQYCSCYSVQSPLDWFSGYWLTFALAVAGRTAVYTGDLRLVANFCMTDRIVNCSSVEATAGCCLSDVGVCSSWSACCFCCWCGGQTADQSY